MNTNTPAVRQPNNESAALSAAPANLATGNKSAEIAADRQEIREAASKIGTLEKASDDSKLDGITGSQINQETQAGVGMGQEQINSGNNYKTVATTVAPMAAGAVTTAVGSGISAGLGLSAACAAVPVWGWIAAGVILLGCGIAYAIGSSKESSGQSQVTMARSTGAMKSGSSTAKSTILQAKAA